MPITNGEVPVRLNFLSGDFGSRAFRNFFAADGEGVDDPLTEVVYRNPIAASRFMKVVMLFGVTCNVVVCASIFSFLTFYWSCCDQCERPLRWWLLINAILQSCQVVIRTVFVKEIWAVENRGGSVERCFGSLAATPAWRMSKAMSLYLYGLLVLGIVWAISAGDCRACKGLYMMTVLVIAQSILRIILVLMCFQWLFPLGNGTEDTTPKAASTEQISALQRTRFRPKRADEEARCAVCLGDYSEGDVLRCFPCKHEFHLLCADQWLRRSNRCPLCMQSIDADFSRTGFFGRIKHLVQQLR